LTLLEPHGAPARRPAPRALTHCSSSVYRGSTFGLFTGWSPKV